VQEQGRSRPLYRQVGRKCSGLMAHRPPNYEGHVAWLHRLTQMDSCGSTKCQQNPRRSSQSGKIWLSLHRLSLLENLREDLIYAHLNNGSRILDVADLRQYIYEQMGRIRTTTLIYNGWTLRERQWPRACSEKNLFHR
jgi:hypothetical protein